jgi:putative ABC transport system permease protein
MKFFKQALMLTLSGLQSLGERRGSSFVTLISVTAVVGVLISLLSMSEGAAIFTGKDSRQDEIVVLSKGAAGAPQSSLARDTLGILADAPGVKKAPDGTPYVLASSMVPLDAIKNDGKRGGVYLVGFTPAVTLLQPDVKIIAGRNYKPAVHEAIVSDPIRKMYRNMQVGDHIKLRGSEWTIVGVFAGTDSLGDSVLRADADTVMSAFGRNTFQQADVRLNSVADVHAFKDWVSANPALSVDMKTLQENFKDNFSALNQLLDFVAYFVGGVMAVGAVFGALNSLYASVDSRRREIATLRAIGFGSGPIILSVLTEGMLLALPGAFIGAAIAWTLYNGHVISVSGLVFHLTVTPHLVVVAVLWALSIGLIGASLPAVRASRQPVATALRAH